MKKTKIVIIVLLLVVVSILFYGLVLYPTHVKKTCTKTAQTFSKDYQEQFYINCIAESGLEIRD